MEIREEIYVFFSHIEEVTIPAGCPILAKLGWDASYSGRSGKRAPCRT
jgi:hypothetical protein